MIGLTECLARPIDAAVHIVKPNDPLLARILSSIEAVSLSYRFQYQNQKKFAYLRGIAADHLASSLIEAVDKEAIRLGKDPASLSPESLDQIVAAISEKISREITSRQDELKVALQSSPLFSVGGPEAEEGVQKLLEFVRIYIESKMHVAIGVIKLAVEALAKVAVVHRDAIRAHIAHMEQNPDAEPSKEYTEGARAKLLAEIEGRYEEVKGYVGKFFTGLLSALDSGPDDEAAAE